MRALGSPSRTRIALAVGVALAVIVALVLVVRGGGDDGGLRIVRGAPATGFPLRGSGAGDEAAIRSAAEAWVRSARRGDDSWADRDDPEVTVLWAGPLSRETDGVVLVSATRAAVLERRRGDDSWQIDSAVAGDPEDPVLVAGGGAVLVRQGTQASFLVAEAPRSDGDAAARENDGLWHRGSSDLPDGALLLPGGVRSRFSSATPTRPPVGVFFPGSVTAGAARSPGLRELSPRLLARLSADAAELSPRTERSDPARQSAQRLVAAASAAEPPARDDAAPQRPTRMPRLDLVAERILEPLGPVVVLSSSPSPLGSGSDRRRPALVAAAGGTVVAGRRDAVTAIRLGGTEAPLRADDGPAFGAAYVTREVRPDDGTSNADEDAEPRVDGPYLLVAGDEDVAGIEVRAGQRTLRVAAPVGLVRASWLPRADTRAPSTADVAILGRTAGGALVVPDVPGTDVVAVEARE